NLIISFYKSFNSILVLLQQNRSMIKTYNKSFLVVLLSVIIFGLTACGPTTRTLAIEEGWELIGEQKANFVRDNDEIMVNSTNLFTDIRIKVEKKNVVLHSLKIVFPNGDKMEPAMDKVLGADQYSNIINISPTGKQIRSIQAKYRSTGNILKGRGNILIFGKRYTGY